MASKTTGFQPVPSFEYELFEGDPDRLRTVVATPNQVSPWIDPATLKLRHRIGRGPFGDVWLATHHRKTDDYEEHHEVAVKMLHPIREEDKNAVIAKFHDLFNKCQGSHRICWLHGVSIISGKVCVIMKFYEGSVGDKMALLKGGKLPLADVLRYGIDLAQGILELHSKEILVLNLKPSNFLLNKNDEAILGDLGISFMLLGFPLPNSDMARRLGTPNYMAPEQWQPDVRGPISYETDSWGFGCSLVEMLTGIYPWSGRSVEEIYQAVVRKQEKPLIPSGLPPTIEKVILGCFEFDFRSRPLMTNIIHAFTSLQSAVDRDGHWISPGNTVSVDKSTGNGYNTQWFLSKDNLLVDDMVRSRKPSNSCKLENMEVPEGIVVGVEQSADLDSYVLVRVHGIHDPVRVQTTTLERVTSGLSPGDWVRLKQEDKRHSPVGILHSIDRSGRVAVAFMGLETLWKGDSSELQMAESYCIGQFVRLKSSVFCPRFEWPHKAGGGWATGRICQILPNGCLQVKFPGRLDFGDKWSSTLADPAEVEMVSFSTCPGMVKKYQHLEDFHWAIRPVLIAFGLFTAMKLGFCVGKKIGRSKAKNGGESIPQAENSQYIDQNVAGNTGWIPPPVANIIFREGTITVPAR